MTDRSRKASFFIPVVVLALCVRSLGASDAGESASQSETIVSDKDSVELVGDSSVGESISRRPDLSFANVTINGAGFWNVPFEHPCRCQWNRLR